MADETKQPNNTNPDNAGTNDNAANAGPDLSTPLGRLQAAQFVREDLRTRLSPSHYSPEVRSGFPEYENLRKIDVGLVPGMDQQELRARRQTTGTKIANGLGKMAITAGTAFLEPAAMLLDSGATGRVNFDGYLVNQLDAANAWAQEVMPHYYSQAEIDASVLENMVGTGAANFWSDKFLNGLGFLIGAVGTGMATGGVGLGAGLGRSAYKVGKMLNTGTKFSQAGRYGRKLAKGYKESRNLSKFADEGYQSIAELRGTQAVGGTIAALGESSLEARGAKHAVMDEMFKLRESGDERYTNMSDEQIENEANSIANVNFAVNMFLVGSTNARQFGALFSPRSLRQAANNFTGNIRRAADGTYEATKTGRLSKVVQALENPASEAFQELAQYTAEHAASEFVKAKYDPNAGYLAQTTGLLTEMVGSMASNLGTKEGQESAVLGALLGTLGLPGIGGGVVSTVKGINQQDAQAAAAAKVLNQAQLNPALAGIIDKYGDSLKDAGVGELIRSTAAHTKLEEDKAIAILKGDQLMYDIASAQQFNNYVMSRSQAGKLDDVITDLEAIREMTPEEFQQAFGYTQEEFQRNVKSIPEFVDNLIERARDIDSVGNGIDLRLRQLGVNPGTPQYDYIMQNGLLIGEADSMEQRYAEELSELTKTLDSRTAKEITKATRQLAGKKGTVTRTRNKLNNVQKQLDLLRKMALTDKDTFGDQIAELEQEMEIIRGYKVNLRPEETNFMVESEIEINALREKIQNQYKQTLTNLVSERKETNEKLNRFKKELQQLEAVERQLKAEEDRINYDPTSLKEFIDQLNAWKTENPHKADQADKLMKNLVNLALQRRLFGSTLEQALKSKEGVDNATPKEVKEEQKKVTEPEQAPPTAPAAPQQPTAQPTPLTGTQPTGDPGDQTGQSAAERVAAGLAAQLGIPTPTKGAQPQPKKSDPADKPDDTQSEQEIKELNSKITDAVRSIASQYKNGKLTATDALAATKQLNNWASKQSGVTKDTKDRVKNAIEFLENEVVKEKSTIIESPDALVKVFDKYLDKDALAAKETVTKDDVANRIELVIEEETDESPARFNRQTVPIGINTGKPLNNSPIRIKKEQPITIRVFVTKENGERVEMGVLLLPTRYTYNGIDLKPSNANHLAAMNPGWASGGQPTEAGEQFAEYHTKLSTIQKQLENRTGETLTTEQVKELFNPVQSFFYGRKLPLDKRKSLSRSPEMKMEYTYTDPLTNRDETVSGFVMLQIEDGKVKSVTRDGNKVTDGEAIYLDSLIKQHERIIANITSPFVALTPRGIRVLGYPAKNVGETFTKLRELYENDDYVNEDLVRQATNIFFATGPSGWTYRLRINKKGEPFVSAFKRGEKQITFNLFGKDQTNKAKAFFKKATSPNDLVDLINKQLDFYSKHPTKADQFKLLPKVSNIYEAVPRGQESPSTMVINHEQGSRLVLLPADKTTQTQTTQKKTPSAPTKSSPARQPQVADKTVSTASVQIGQKTLSRDYTVKEVLSDPNAPAEVKQWLKTKYEWYDVSDSNNIDDELENYSIQEAFEESLNLAVKHQTDKEVKEVEKLLDSFIAYDKTIVTKTTQPTAETGKISGVTQPVQITSQSLSRLQELESVAKTPLHFKKAQSKADPLVAGKTYTELNNEYRQLKAEQAKNAKDVGLSDTQNLTVPGSNPLGSFEKQNEVTAAFDRFSDKETLLEYIEQADDIPSTLKEMIRKAVAASPDLNIIVDRNLSPTYSRGLGPESDQYLFPLLNNMARRKNITGPLLMFGEDHIADIATQTGIPVNEAIAYALMHELTHHQFNKLTPEVEAQMRDVFEQFKAYHAKEPFEDWRDVSDYQLSFDEFLAEAISNKEFAMYLDKIPYKQTNRSLLQKIIDFILSAIGIRKSLHRVAMKNYAKTIKTPLEQRTKLAGQEPINGIMLRKEFADQEGNIAYIHSGRSERLINTIALRVGNKVGDNFSEADVLDEIQYFAEEYYTYDNWEAEINHVDETQGEGRALQIAEEIEEISNALSLPENVDTIKQEVRNRLALVSFNPEQIDEAERIEDERNTDNWRVDNNEVGGFGSLSKEMKQIIAFTTIPTDEFNIGLLEGDLENDKYQLAINPFQVYAGIERALANTPRDKMLNKLRIYAQTNPQANAFYKSLIKQVLGTETWDGNPDVLDKAKDSNIYNRFLSAFNKVKQIQYTTLVDVKTGNVRVFRANYANIKQQQFDRWEVNFSGHLKRNPSEVTETLEAILAYFQDGLMDRLGITQENAVRNFDVEAKDLVELFNEVGINLSPGYIKFSLIAHAANGIRQSKEKLDDAGMANDYVNSLLEYHEQFSDVMPLNFDDNLEHIIETLKEGGNPFIKGWKRNKTIATENEAGEQVEEEVSVVDDANIGRLQNMADGNATFDESVGDSTFQNAEGKTIFDKVFPSYAATETMAFQSGFRREFLESENREDGLRSLRDAYNLSGYEAEMLYDILKDNPLLNHPDADLIFNHQFVLHTIDGMRQTSLKESKDGNVYEEKWQTPKPGQAYGKMDSRAKLLQAYTLYTNVQKRGSTKKEFALYNIGVNETANTTYITYLPKETYWTSDGPTDGAVDMMMTFLRQEYNEVTKGAREINEIKNGAKTNNIIKGYHTGSFDTDTDPLTRDTSKEPRGLHLFNFRKWENENRELYNQIVEQARAGVSFEEAIADIKTDNRTVRDVIRTELQDAVNDHVEYLAEPSISLIQENPDGGYNNKLLPSQFQEDPKESPEKGAVVSEASIGNFFLNDWFNTMAFNQLLDGYDGYAFKNYVDKVKRNKGKLAAGPSSDTGKFTAVVMTLPEYILDEKDGYEPGHPLYGQKVDRTDAQSEATTEFYINKYLKPFGKWTNKVKDIYEKKIARGLPLSSYEERILADNNAQLTPRKMVYRNRFYYFKTSVNTLTRYETSMLKEQFPETSKVFDDRHESLRRAKELYESAPSLHNRAMLRQAQDAVHEMYEPIPGREAQHNKLNTMERRGIDYVLYDSASKMVSRDVTPVDNLDAANIHLYDSQYFREQVSTDGVKTKIVDGSQKQQLIWSEQDHSAEASFKGRSLGAGGVGKIVDNHERLKADRIKMSYDKLVKTILEQDGSPKYKELLASFKQSLLRSNADPYLLTLFDATEDGTPKFSLNLTPIEAKFQAMFLSFVSDHSLKQKRAGYKMTLVSDYGYEVARDANGKVIRADDIRTNPERRNDVVSTSRLRHRVPDGRGGYYSEVIVPAMIAELWSLKPGDAIPENLAELFGVRIPTQDKHSMSAMRVVDILPRYKGNAIIMPLENIILSGADFDIDAEYVDRYDIFMSGDDVIAHGDYLNINRKDGRIARAFEEFAQHEYKNNRNLREQIRALKESNEQYRDLQDKIAALKRLLEKRGTLTEAEIEETFEAHRAASEEWTTLGLIQLEKMNADKTLSKRLNDQIALSSVIISDAISTLRNLKPKKDEAKALKARIMKQLEPMQQEARFMEYMFTLEAMNTEEAGVFTIPEGTESLLPAERFRAKYTDQIEANKKAVDAGDLNNYRPITKGELNNALLDMEFTLLHNSANESISATPATMDVVQNEVDYVNELRAQGRTGVSRNQATGTNDLTSKSIHSTNNDTGSRNIGIMAVLNIMFQYMHNAGTNIVKKGKKKIKQGLKLNTIRDENGEIEANAPMFNNEEYGHFGNKVVGQAEIYANIDDEIRTNDSLSAYLSSATDNAAVLHAADLSLSEDTLAAYGTAIALNTPPRLMTLTVLQPLVQQFANDLKIASTPVKTRKEDSDLSIGKVKMNYGKIAGEKYTTDIVLQYENNPEQLLDLAFKYQLGLDAPGISENEMRDIQIFALREFLKAQEYADFTRNFTKILGLIRGVDSNWPDVNKVSEALSELGIEIVTKPGGNSWNPADLVIRQKQIVVDEETQSVFEVSKLPFDMMKVINSNPFLQEELKTFQAIVNMSPKFFVAESPVAKRILEIMKVNLRGKTGQLTDNFKTLRNSLLTFMMNKAYGQQFDYFNDPQERLNRLVTPYYHEQFEAIKEMDEFKDNALLNFLRPITVNKRSGAFTGQTLYMFEGNTRTKENPDRVQELMDAYRLLLQNPETRDFARDLFFYLRDKDGLQFVNRSFIRQISPNLFTDASVALKEVEKILGDPKATDEDYRRVFGANRVGLYTEFKDLFSRHSENQFLLPFMKEGANVVTKDKDTIIGVVDNKLVINLTAGFKKGKGKNKEQYKANITAITDKAGGLLKETYDKNGHLRLVFPEYINVGGTIHKLSGLRQTGVKLDSVVRDKPSFIKKGELFAWGNYAEYTPINPIGTKEVSPYAFSPQDWDTFIAETIVPAIEAKQKKDVPAPSAEETTEETDPTARVAAGLAAQLGIPAPKKPKQPVEETTDEQYYTGDIQPTPNTVFVFGSNPEGRHGAGAARAAVENFGAVKGKAEGLQGNAFAIVTKNLAKAKEQGLYSQKQINDFAENELIPFYKENGFKDAIIPDARKFSKERSIQPSAIINSIKKLYQTAKLEPGKEFKVAYRNKLFEPTLNGYLGGELIEMFNAAGPIPFNVIFSKEWFDTGKLDFQKIYPKQTSSSKPSSSAQRVAEGLARQLGIPPPKKAQIASTEGRITRLKAETILDDLSAKFGLPYEFDETLDVVGLFKDGKVYINPNLVAEDTPFHEFAHPFVMVIKKQNPLLYKRLVRQIEKEGSILEATRSKYRTYYQEQGLEGQALEDALVEEAIVEAIGRYAAKYSKQPSNVTGLWAVIKQFLKRIGKIISGLVEGAQKKVVPAYLDPNTTLEQLGEMMNLENRIELTERDFKNSIAYAKLSDKDKQFYNEQVDRGTEAQKDVTRRLLSIQENFELNDEGTGYVDSETGEVFTRTSDYITEQDTTGRYGFDGDPDAYEDNRQWGNILDEVLSSVVLDESIDEAKVRIKKMDTRGAEVDESQIRKIYNAFKKIRRENPDDIILTQQIVLSANQKVAGTVDVLLVSPDGKLKIIDLKSSIKPTNFTGEYTPTGIPKFEDFEAVGVDGDVYVNNYRRGFKTAEGLTKASKYERHQAQQSLYKGMYESLGYEVESLSILPVHLQETTGSVVTKLEMEEQFEIPENSDWSGLMTKVSASEIDITSHSQYSKILNQVKVLLQEKLDNLRNKKYKNEAEKRRQIKRLQERIDAVPKLKQLDVFIDSLYNTFVGGEANLFKSYNKKVDTLRKKLADPSITGKEKEQILQNGINELVEISSMTRKYEDIMSELSAMYDEFRSVDVLNPEKGSPLWKLKTVIEAKDRILGRFESDVKPLIAETLAEYINPEINEKIDETTKAQIKRLEEKLAKRNDEGKSFFYRTRSDFMRNQLRSLKSKALPIDKAKILQDLDSIDSDQGLIEFLFTPLSSSSDTVLALFAKMVKSKFEQARQGAREFGLVAAKRYKEFTAATGRSTTNVAETNKGLYEFVTELRRDPETGKYVEVKRAAFVQQFDVTAYNKDRLNMLTQIEAIDEEIKEATSPAEKKKLRDKKSAIRAAFYKEAHTAKSSEEIKEIMAEWQSDIREAYAENETEGKAKYREYIRWVSDNLYDKDMFARYKSGEISYKDYLDSMIDDLKNDRLHVISPSSISLRKPDVSKYTNANWTALQADSELKSFYDFLIGKYFSSQERLPEYVSAHPFKRYYLPSIAKKGFDRVVENGPKNYVSYKTASLALTQEEDIEVIGAQAYGDKSDKQIPVYYTQYMKAEDVSLDLIASVSRFEAMSLKYQATSEVQAAASATLTSVKGRDVALTDSRGKKVLNKAAKQLGIESYVKKHDGNVAAAWLEAFIDMQIYGETQKVEEKTILGRQVRLDKLSNGFMSFLAHTQIGGNPILSAANWLQAKAQNAFEAASGEFFGKTTYAKAAGEYAMNVHNFTEDLVKPVNESLIGQLTDAYDALQGEFFDKFGHKMSQSAAKKAWSSNTWFALQHAGEHQAQVTAMIALMMETKVKQGDKEISLYDAYEIKDGVLTLKDGVELEGKVTENGLVSEDVMNRLHALNKRMHGVYNKFDQATVQRHSLGRLALMYRKFVVPGFKKRYKTRGIDHELGAITEGTYRTLFNVLITDGKEMVKMLTFQDNELTDFERANIKRALTELTAILVTMVVGLLLRAMMKAGDDDEKRMLAYPTYLALRLNTELAFYAPWAVPIGATPKDTFRLLRTPTVATTFFEKSINLVSQLSNPFEEYQRDTGLANKGDLKLKIKFWKLFGFNGYNMNPEDAIKVLEMTTK